MYYWPSADANSGGTRIYSGTAIRLAADYASTGSNGRYHMISPSGWINWTYVQDINAVYKTVTDKCTAPTSLSIANKVMTITGGGGGDLNTFTAFGVSWRERGINASSFGSWSADEDVSTRSVNVTANSGYVRQYRVRTKGSAGSSYYSDYVICETLVNGNTAADTPTVMLPISGLATPGTSAVLKIYCPAEADGDTMTLYRNLDNAGWNAIQQLTAAGGYAFDLLSLRAGTHTIQYKLADANGEEGGVDSITIICDGASWGREINSGDVIANKEISFVADINEMLEKLNQQRAFYGLPEMTLPGTVGRVGDWKSQLAAMQNGVDEYRAALGRAGYGFEEASGWPNAAQINQLRKAILDN